MLIAIWDLNLDPMVTLQVFSAITPPLVAEHFPRSPFADFKNFKAVVRLRLGREDIAKFMGTPPKEYSRTRLDMLKAGAYGLI